MHVHANYNLQLAAMGSNRDEIQEIAARRAAEVRRRLAAIAGQEAGAPDDDAFVKAISAADTEPPDNTYPATNGGAHVFEEPSAAETTTTAREQGSLFSALA